jgi:hypothetical protein
LSCEPPRFSRIRGNQAKDVQQHCRPSSPNATYSINMQAAGCTSKRHQHNARDRLRAEQVSDAIVLLAEKSLGHITPMTRPA